MEKKLQLFEAFGVELEYMIVDRQTLDVRPISDQLLSAAAGEIVSEVDMGVISWSNELALHIIELKTSQPATDLTALPAAFAEQISLIDRMLEPLGAMLMPTAMHPWMRPNDELKLWPHDYNPVYEAYDRIFDCRGHGWANLQSTHLNLPFGDDDQFGRLHAAIRLILPLLAGLAASSPMVEGSLTGIADNRLEFYRHNSRRLPLITGDVVPEPVFTRHAYESEIFEPMYASIRSLDTAAILQHEWLNSRGAIARFDRDAIEIRVLDVQASPAADIGICEVIVAVLRSLAEERWTSLAEQQKVPTRMLADLFVDTVRLAERAEVADAELLRQFGVVDRTSMSLAELWRYLLDTVSSQQVSQRQELDNILDSGPLSRRIEKAILHGRSTRDVYSELCFSS